MITCITPNQRTSPSEGSCPALMVLTCCMHSVPSQSLQDQDACACRPYAGQSHLQSWQTPTPCQSTGRHKHTMLTSGRPCTLPVMLPSTEACASQRAADSLVLTTLMRSTTLHIPVGTLPRLMMSMQVVPRLWLGQFSKVLEVALLINLYLPWLWDRADAVDMCFWLGNISWFHHNEIWGKPWLLTD